MWSAIFAIVIISIGIVATVARWLAATKDPIALVVASQQRGSRDVEARLSGGFRWAPLQKSNSKKNVSADVAVFRAANEIERMCEAGASPSVLHAKGLAQILKGDARAAISTLEPLAKHADARILNDLGAAQYLVAVRKSDPSRLPQALVAIDAALRLQPELPEALFNRALTIEALGLRDLAHDAWEAYLIVDRAGGWSSEARAHLKELAPEEDFNAVLTRDYERLAADPSAARAFARRYRQRARIWGEAEILGDWARASQRNRPEEAAKHLRLAREFGAELSAGGDGTLRALTEAIETNDPSRHSTLVQAHLHLSDGLRAYRDRRPNDAQPLLAAASEEFARIGNPGQWRARHFLAGTMFLQGKIGDCGSEMRTILAALPATFAAPRAEALWILASVAVSEGRWGETIDKWTESLSLYDRLGEANNAAVVRQQLVFTFDRLGNPTRAWKYRVTALRELGRELSTRQQEAIGSLVRAAIMDRDWPTAASFARLEVDVGRKVNRTAMLIDSLLYRAEVRSRLHEEEAARADLNEARRLIAHVPDVAFREGVEVTANVVQASLSDARLAVTLLTNAIEYHSTKGRRMYLPDLLQRRGSAFRMMNDDARAAADYEAGVAELERHRTTIAQGEDRWGVFHAADDLFGEAIGLALGRGDVRTAFDYSERARARALFDTMRLDWRPMTLADVPPQTSVIEYSLHDNMLFIFILNEHGLRAVSVMIQRDQLDKDVIEIRRTVQPSMRARFDGAARRLYQALIRPVERELIGAESLAIVADPALQSIPFSSLVDQSGRYLIETHAITLEPSAAFLAAAKQPERNRGNVLVIEGAEDAGRLDAARREVRAIAALYRKATFLGPAHATRAAFVREARNADCIHFAGHGFASNEGTAGYLLLARDSDDGRFRLDDIASMALPRTSVVVLAACDTAAGEIRSTEGTISVARAFLAAGVPSVIATLWPIEDDAAADFFSVLHQNLARGLSPRDALRVTQMEWIRRGADAPARWAAIEVIGK